MICQQEDRRSSKRQPRKDLSKLHPVMIVDSFKNSRGKDMVKYLPLSHDFNGNENIKVGKSLDYGISGSGTDRRSKIHISKPREIELDKFKGRRIPDLHITKRGLEKLRRDTGENAPRTRNGWYNRKTVQGPDDAGPSTTTAAGRSRRTVQGPDDAGPSTTTAARRSRRTVQGPDDAGPSTTTAARRSRRTVQGPDDAGPSTTTAARPRPGDDTYSD